MRTYQRLLLFLLVALVVAALFGPWASALWNSLFDSHAEFSQIFGGLFIAGATVLVLSDRSLLGLQFLRESGLGPLQRGTTDLLGGFSVAAASIAALGLFMSMAGIFTPGFFHSFHSSFEWTGKALLTSLTVGFFEELFFRGIFFKGLLDDGRQAAAFASANLLYAASHFIRPPENFALSGLEPLGGARYFIETLRPFLDAGEVLPGFIGLLIIGLVLSYALLRTRSLYLSIGLHAGWVFGLKTIRIFGEFQRADLGPLFGSSEPKIVSGIVTWIGIVLVGLVVHLITRPHPNPLPGREREGRGSPK